MIHKTDDNVIIYQGDCREEMAKIPDNSVDAIVTDPPYELGFMNKSWDSTGIANNVEVWKECLRVLKPGGHLLSFGGTRTQHRMVSAIEDAGFEIRDQLQWIFATGFPKSMNIGKAIDKHLGHTPIDVGESPNWRESKRNREQFGKMEVRGENAGRITLPSSSQAKEWQGWGTCLKPAHEIICLARKPVSEKTVAENVLKWGTGGLNIDDCRIPVDPNVDDMLRETTRGKRVTETWEDGSGFKNENNHLTGVREDGRFPANIIFDEEAGRLLDEQAPKTGAFAPVKSGYNGESNGIYGDYSTKGDDGASFHADGLQGASRFFYCPKSSKNERNAGLDGCEEKKMGRNQSSLDGGKMLTGSGNERSNTKINFHPTVKPIKLIEYLVKLITPPNGVVLDPFMGSGTTGIAAKNLGHRFIGIEMDKEYCEIAQKRIAFVSKEKQLTMLDAV